MVSVFLTRGFLIGEPAPEVLRLVLAETAGDDFSAQAGLRRDRRDVIDAGVAYSNLTLTSRTPKRQRPQERQAGTRAAPPTCPSGITGGS